MVALYQRVHCQRCAPRLPVSVWHLILSFSSFGFNDITNRTLYKYFSEKAYWTATTWNTQLPSFAKVV